MSAVGFDEYDYLERQINAGRDSSYERSKHMKFYTDYDDEPREHRSRSRSRSRSRRHRSSSGERRRRRDRSPRRLRRARTPPEVRREREQDRELQELERATRTVFAYNLNIRADERDLFEFFSKGGKVTDIKLIADRNTRKSKGLAYIEFARKEDVYAALQMTGSIFMGQPIMVKSAEAEKNMAWEAQQQAKMSLMSQTAAPPQAAGAGPCKLQINNLHPELLESDLKPLFEPFGTVDFVQVARDGFGRSMKHAHIQFSTGSNAQKAMSHWNGQVVAGNILSVSIAAAGGGGGGVPTLAELDEDEDNLKLSSQARAHLMNKLASSAGLSTPLQPPTPPGYSGAPTSMQPQVSSALQLEQGLLGPASPIPTPCLLLKNMFEPQEMNREEEQEILQDVVDECSKYGKVVHCFVDKVSKGFVYCKFETMDSARAAAVALHGRWYSGHQIAADYQFLQVYNNFFKL